jgi:hypothetical protein
MTYAFTLGGEFRRHNRGRLEPMELSLAQALEKPSDSSGLEPAFAHTGPEPALVKPRRPHRRTKPRLLTRAEIDQRSKTGHAIRMFDNMVSAITTDLGGRDQLTAMELALVEAFAGESVTLNNINTRQLLGEKVSLSDQALAASTMVRVATRFCNGAPRMSARHRQLRKNTSLLNRDRKSKQTAHLMRCAREAACDAEGIFRRRRTGRPCPSR